MLGAALDELLRAMLVELLIGSLDELTTAIEEPSFCDALWEELEGGVDVKLLASMEELLAAMEESLNAAEELLARAEELLEMAGELLAATLDELTTALLETTKLDELLAGALELGLEVKELEAAGLDVIAGLDVSAGLDVIAGLDVGDNATEDVGAMLEEGLRDESELL